MRFARGASRVLPMALAVTGYLSFAAADRAAASPLAPTSAVAAESAVTPVALNADEALEYDNGTAANGDEARATVRALIVSKGDTLSSLLIAAGVDRRDAEAAIATLRNRFDPRKLRVGQRLVVVSEGGAGKARRLAALSLETGRGSYLVVERRGGRRFVSEIMAHPLLPDPGAETSPMRRTVHIRKGDTLTHVLVRAGGTRDDAESVARAMGRYVNLRQLQVGQELTIALRPGGFGARPVLATVSLRLGPGSYVVAERSALGAYAGRRAPEPPPIAEHAASAEPPDSAAAPVGDAVADESADRPDPLVDADLDADPDADPDDGRQTYRIEKGDTLTDALVWAGSRRQDAYAAAAALARHFNPRKLRVGQELTIVFDPGGETRLGGLAAVSLKLKNGRFVVAGRGDDGQFSSDIAPEPLIPAFPAEAESPGTETGEGALLLSGEAEYKTLRARKGDTLTTVLLRAGVAWRATDAAVSALSRHFDPRRLQVGQELSAVFDRAAQTARPQLAAVSLTLGERSFVIARRDDDGSFTSWPARESLAAYFDDALLAAALAPPPPEIALASVPDNAERKSLAVRAGDTLMKALLRAGSPPRDAEAAIKALTPLFDPRKLRAGQTLSVALAPPAEDGRAVLHRLTIAVAPGRNVESGRAEEGGFAARAVEVPLERLMVHAGGVIDSSLYKAAADAGVPVPVLMEMIRAFSFDVDFQREIQRDDSFEVLLERYLDETGAPVREGNILFAALTLSGTPLKIYRHTARDGLADYYTENGHSVRKALLRTPIDGARLTSGYGQRKHPILGYNKMHRGVDFAANSGTPFMAAGDGVVERAGWNGAYGRYIRIRHRGQYATAYAHLSRIAKGIKRGRRVKQGQVIGYVGSTGRSTGPHLHYEVLLRGSQIDPLKVKLPTGAKLKGAELAAFKQSRQEIERQLAALPLVRRVADAMLPAMACEGTDEGAAAEPAC